MEAALHSYEGESRSDTRWARDADVIPVDRTTGAKVCAGCGTGREGDAAYVAPFVRDRPAVQWRRPPRRAGVAGSCQPQYDADLYPRDQSAASCGAPKVP